ncbi:MAG: hypothetical protein REI11_04290 [Patulibacter sp.]|nr:hypothetical protein [Patulibacter sp.]
MSVLAAAADTPLVDWTALWKILLVALCGGVGVTAVFGFGVLRLEAFDGDRAAGRSGAATMGSAGRWGAVGLAGVVVGILAMMHKS